MDTNQSHQHDTESSERQTDEHQGSAQSINSEEALTGPETSQKRANLVIVIVLAVVVVVLALMYMWGVRIEEKRSSIEGIFPPEPPALPSPETADVEPTLEDLEADLSSLEIESFDTDMEQLERELEAELEAL